MTAAGPALKRPEGGIERASRRFASAGPAFFVDFSAPGRPFPHFWENTVGSGHAPLALRADWQRTARPLPPGARLRACPLPRPLERRRRDPHRTRRGSSSIPSSTRPGSGTSLLSLGMRPFVELSFMPTALASGRKTVFHYRANVTPPRARDAGRLHREARPARGRSIRAKTRSRRWPFEVWNEPNLKAFWTGTRAGLFPALSRHRAGDQETSRSAFRVGGPATAKNAWIEPIPRVLRAAAASRPDFICTHHYPTDAFGKPGDDTVAQLSKSRRSVLREQARKAREQAGRPAALLHGMELLLEPLRRSARRALRRGVRREDRDGGDRDRGRLQLVDLLGHLRGELLPLDPLPRGVRASDPPRRRQAGLPRFPDAPPHRREILPVQGNPCDGGCLGGPRRTSSGGPPDELAASPAAIRSERARIRLAGIAPGPASVERIDEDHANARRAWAEMGSPAYPDPPPDRGPARGLLGRRRKARRWRRSREAISLEITLPPQSVADGRVPGGAMKRAAPRPHPAPEVRDEEALLERIESQVFRYFQKEAGEENGLVLDKTAPGSPASIAATGLALARLRGRGRARASGAATRPPAGSCARCDSSGTARRAADPDARDTAVSSTTSSTRVTGRRACRMRALDDRHGAAARRSARRGALFRRRDLRREREIRSAADSLYRRAEWTWALNGRRHPFARLEAGDRVSCLPLGGI